MIRAQLTFIPALFVLPLSLFAQNAAYVVDSAGGRVQTIELNQRRVTANITTGAQSAQMLILPGNNFGFVTNAGDNTVAVVDLNANKLKTTIPAGQLPDAITGSPDGRFIYVANQTSNDVTVIDAVALTVIATIPVGATPVDINVSPDGRYIYTANRDDSPGTVTVIDASRLQVISTLTVGASPVQIAVNPNQTAAYTINRASNNLSVISLATNQVVGTIGVGAGPASVAFSTDASRLYVLNQAGGSVSVVNTQKNSVIASIAVGSQPAAIAITYDSLYAYVSNQGSNTLSVLDLAANANVDTVNVGSAPFSVIFDPNENFLFCTNLNSGTVSVVDTNTDAVVVTIPVGGTPSQILQLNGPELRQMAPNPVVSGAVLTLNGEGFLPTSAVTVVAPNRTVTPAVTWLDSEGLTITMPQLPVGANATVYVTNPDGNQSNSLTLISGSASPSILAGGIVEAGSFQTAPYPVTGNGIVAVFGNYPGMTAAAAGTFPLPTTLGGAQVTFNGSPAPLISTSPAAAPPLIDAVVPVRMLALSSARVSVTVGGQTSAPRVVNLAQAAPGGFLIDANYTGLFVHALRAPALVTAADPAQRNEAITVYVSGLGNTLPLPQDGQPAVADVISWSSIQPTVTVGGVPAQVLFGGLVAYYSGLYEVNFVVPQTAPSGNLVSIVVAAGGNTGQAVKMAVQ